MYAKTAFTLAGFAASYVLLVFAARTGWQAAGWGVLLAFFTAQIGYNIQHDGSHNAYSKHPWVNTAMAWTLDLIGGSSYVWRRKHVVLFPLMCHVNYPHISRLVEATCREFGVKYSEHRTIWAGMASHYRWLRRMGMPAPAG